MVKLNKAIFFDRDGVLIDAPINKDKKPTSILKVEDIRFWMELKSLQNIRERLSFNYDH